MNLKLSNEIKAEALRLGFFACGIAKAEAVDEATAHDVRQWLSEGKYAGMEYMNNHTDKRLNPSLLMPGVRSIVSVALSYAPYERIKASEYQLACYAYGQDYHDVMKNKLRALASALGFQPYEEGVSSASSIHVTSSEMLGEVPFTSNKGAGEGQSLSEGVPKTVHFRAFCDTAPVLERYWAVKAGLGWIGKNHQLIIPHAGSMFVLGELFLDVDLEYDEIMPNRCGTCRRCLDACPTGALGQPRDGEKHFAHRFDASLCLSYQTIENRGELSPVVKRAMGNNIYGCDHCQTACPWNRFAQPTTIAELQPHSALLQMTKEQWNNLTEKEYQQLFKGSAVKRAKYAGLVRNIAAVRDNEQQDKKT